MRTRRPNRQHRMLLLALPVVAVAALAACGGGDGDATGGIATLAPTTTTATDDDTGADEPAGAPGSDDSDTATDDTATGDTATPGSDTATGTPSSDPEQAMLDYAECMRDNGIDMPDPEFTGDGGMMMTMGAAEGEGPDPEDYEAADEECAHFMEEARSNIEIDPEQQAEMQEQMLEFAECMREQGIDMPDPQFDENGGMTMQVGEPGDEDAGPRSDEEFAEASEACNEGGGMMPAVAISEDS